MNPKLFYFIYLFVFFVYPQDYYKNSFNGDLIIHSHFSLSYIEDHEQAEWVYHKLNPTLLKGSSKRTNNFRVDPKVITGSAETSDYKKSGYDRGHLAPAGDMKFSKISMSESFFMSNMSPQKPSFNRGGWRKLEALIRNWAINSELHIVTGGILTDELDKIGYNQVSVPNYFYKVVFDYNECKMIGFVMPNTKIVQEINTYIKTIDEIEMLTGIDFFYDLQDEIENKLESEVNINKWRFEY